MAGLYDEEAVTMASLPSVLLGYLDHLKEDQFKLFKWYLSQDVLNGCAPILMGKVEKWADKIDAVDGMVTAYLAEGALTVTLSVLRKMERNDLAQKLEGDLRKLLPTPAGEDSEHKGIPTPSAVMARGDPGLREPSLIRTPPVARVPGDHRRNEARSGGVYYGIHMDTGEPQVSTFLPMRAEQSFNQPMRAEQSFNQPIPFNGRPFPLHLSEVLAMPSPVDQSRFGQCEGPLRDPVSTPCEHRISSHWDQSDPVGGYDCPQCRKRSRTQPAWHAAPAPVFGGLAGMGPDLATTVPPGYTSPGGHGGQQGLCHDIVRADTKQGGPQIWLNSIRKAQEALKMRLTNRFKCIFEGVAKQGKIIFLNDIYTELYITEGGTGGVNDEHEVRQIEMASKRQPMKETSIKCNDIFTPLPGQRKHIRTVLTKGIAGIGKTVSVQKFVLDWAEGKANQDVHFIFTLPFRDLNVLKGRTCSLMQLLHQYFPEMKGVDSLECGGLKVLFIFDGLDECRIPLNFDDSEVWCDVSESTSVDVLLTNLFKGNMLSSALLWITSRPAAAGQIPPDCIQQLTEVRGFNDIQKEEYFMKRFEDQTLARKIVAHVKSTRSLHIMCHIPVFCWISATVLERLLSEEGRGEIPKTLTQLYTHFLLIQMNIKNRKYQGARQTNAKKLSESDKKIILKLGRLAFEQLWKGNLIFYEEDLRECGIDVDEASVHSGLCTEIFKEELGLYEEKVYCFVHLSMQEYLAALHVFYLCTQRDKNVLKPDCMWYKLLKAEDNRGRNEQRGPIPDYAENPQTGPNPEIILKPDYMGDEKIEIPFSTPLFQLHRQAIGIALQSENGHLDLFLRFFLGISLDSNQALLKDLLTPTSSWQSTKLTATYLKEKIKRQRSAENTILLFHCLNELNDNSLVEEMQAALRSGMLLKTQLELHHFSALAYVFLMSEEVLDEFDLKIYNKGNMGFQQLVPVVKTCRWARLDSCDLQSESSETIASALTMNNSHLQGLDLGFNNDLRDTGVVLLSLGLTSPHCRLQRLMLAGCNITKISCDALASALCLNPSHLTELDLSHNRIGDPGAALLFTGLKSPNCNLEKLWLGNCNLTGSCCAEVASILGLRHSHLRELELRDNDLQVSAVRALSAGLGDLECKLQKLGLSGCRVTEEGCASLSEAVCSHSSRLRELDLSYNHLGASGLRALSAAQEDPNRQLEKLLVDHGGERRDRHGLLKYACQLELEPPSTTENPKVIIWPGFASHPSSKLLLSRNPLPSRCYWEVEWTVRNISLGLTSKGTSCIDFTKNTGSVTLQRFDETISLVHFRKGISVNPRVRKFQRVGVYLDRPAGVVSFYGISSDTVSLLHTVRTTFTEPLFAGFMVHPDSSVALCMLG